MANNYIKTSRNLITSVILFVFSVSLLTTFGTIKVDAARCSNNTKSYESCTISLNQECPHVREKKFSRGVTTCLPTETKEQFDRRRAQEISQQNPNSQAVIYTDSFRNPDACILESKIQMGDILNPVEFFPVIPEDCGSADGRAVPLSLAVAPDIALRFFGALASLVFYLFFFVAIFSGIMWIYGGFDGQSNIKAKRNFKDSFLGLVLVTTVYAIINTIMIVLGASSINTDISTFFTF
jgi:hypothetical protein